MSPRVPASVPASVFPIIAATNQTIGALNIVKGWVGELIEFAGALSTAGERLSTIGLDLAKSEAKVQFWRKYWVVEEETSERYQTELWGRQGEIIKKQLDSLKNIFESIGRDLEPLPKDRFTKADRVSFTTHTAPKIESKLERAKKEGEDLQQLSIDAYRAKHGITVSDGRLTEEQRRKALSSVHLDLAIEARKFSRGLYECCSAASRKFGDDIADIKLEVDLSLEDQGLEANTISERIDPLTHYHFLVRYNEHAVDLFIEGPFPQDSTKVDEIPKDSLFLRAVIDAYLAHRQTTQSPLNFRIPHYGPEKYFRSRSSSPQERIPISDRETAIMRSVESLLYPCTGPIPSGVEEFPFSQRIVLAFKIVEFSLLLCGTTWLTSLTSRAIQRSVQVNDRNRFVLVTPVKSREYDEADGRKLAAHIFNTGRLLAEIGIGKIVDTADLSPRRQQEFKISEHQSPVPQQVPLARLETLLREQGFGDKYIDAVSFCLTSKTQECWHMVKKGRAKAGDEKYKEALAEYYLAVYLPMQELVRLDWEEMDD